MKKNLLWPTLLVVVILILMLSGILLQCSTKKKSYVDPEYKDLKVGRRDSIRTLAAFMGYQFRQKHFGDCWRIEYDTIGLIKKDSMNYRMGLTRLKWYSVAVPILVDSAFAAAYKVPMLDTAGKPNVVRFQMDLEPKYVRDGVTDLDSALRYLDQFMIRDTIRK